MRTIGLDERLAQTAQSGRYGRTFAIWKGQMQRLEKKGFRVTILRQLKKANFLCYISWIQPKAGTFSEELYNISKENCVPIHCSNYASVMAYLKQVANMTALSGVVSVEEDITDQLTKDGFSFTVLNEEPFTLYVSWHSPIENTLAYGYRTAATNLWLSETHLAPPQE